METFYITFGRTGIRNGWVRVEAYNEEIVRAWAFKEYGNLWSMVYDEAEWQRMTEAHERETFYPLGEMAFAPLFYNLASEVGA